MDSQEQLSLTAKLSLSHKLSSLALDCKNETIVTVTSDRHNPIKIYDYFGQLMRQFGGGIAGLGTGNFTSIGVDTKYDLYVIPCGKSVVLIDHEGKVQDTIAIGQFSHLIGVAFCPKADMYAILSQERDIHDITSYRILLVNPDKKSRVFPLVSGHGLTEPTSISVGFLENAECVFVCDGADRKLKVYKLDGTLAKVVQHPTSSLWYPHRATVNYNGDLLVYDPNSACIEELYHTSDFRKLAAFYEIGGEHEAHVDFAVDKLLKLFAVSCNKDVYLYKQNSRTTNINDTNNNETVVELEDLALEEEITYNTRL